MLPGVPLPVITPGLLRVADVTKDEGEDAAKICEVAGQLATQITGEPLERLMKASR
ncbi:MAG: hypothetical protein HN559_30115 [Gemmatimonadetes bacterium]|nr:hypothetical protein [Gemmatimonadota bacterium]MBT7599198.1 hypothetical protein [Gemmatimonadota bacterium]